MAIYDAESPLQSLVYWFRVQILKCLKGNAHWGFILTLEEAVWQKKIPSQSQFTSQSFQMHLLSKWSALSCHGDGWIIISDLNMGFQSVTAWLPWSFSGRPLISCCLSGYLMAPPPPPFPKAKSRVERLLSCIFLKQAFQTLFCPLCSNRRDVWRCESKAGFLSQVLFFHFSHKYCTYVPLCWKCLSMIHATMPL